MKKNVIISIIGFLGVFFSSLLIIGLLPFLLILIGVVKIYELNEDR